MKHSLQPRSIAVVYGTRSEMIKLAPLVAELGPAAKLIHTGQHFDPELVEDIADDLNLPLPDETIAIGGGSRASQIGSGISLLEPKLAGSAAVVVQGDTNSSLSGAIAANSLDLPLFHVEAGLRGFDRRMPEEHNRVLIDHLSDRCWAPTDLNAQNLLAEHIESERVETTGNTIVQAVWSMLPSSGERRDRREAYGLSGSYILTTLHRPENVDSPDRLRRILEVLAKLPREVVLPLHPRTSSNVSKFGLKKQLGRLTVIPSVGYRDFLSLLAGCSIAISDSGGIQEEVSILKVPLVVIRRSTERPEVLGTFATLVVEPDAASDAAVHLIEHEDWTKRRLRTIDSPFGDGKAANRMFESLDRFVREGR